jgi:hypothetical protein
MGIKESDISILIPTFRYREKLARALESALASEAGEIIVTDDRSLDGSMELLSAYKDSRLRVFENERNLGLWENHKRALDLSTKSWIKFIQADDYLLPGGLAAYAAAADDRVSIVFGAPTVKDDITGEVMYFHRVDRVTRVDFDQLRYLMADAGWVLGSPSHMMLRKDAIELDPQVWKTRISADLVVGSIAAARGETILLPIGAMGQGEHPRQDARTQSAELGLDRSVASLAYLRRRPEPGLRWLANMWTILQLSPVLKTTAKGLLAGQGSKLQMVRNPARLLADLSPRDWREIWDNRALLRRAARFRRNAQLPLDLCGLLQREAPAAK